MGEKLKNLDVLAVDLCDEIIESSYQILKKIEEKDESFKEDVENLTFAIKSVACFAFIPRLAELSFKLYQNPDKIKSILSEMLKLAKEIKENGFEPSTSEPTGKIAFIKTKQGTFAINADFITRVLENGTKECKYIASFDLTPDTKEAFIIYIKVKNKELALFSSSRPYVIDENKVDKDKITFLTL